LGDSHKIFSRKIRFTINPKIYAVSEIHSKLYEKLWGISIRGKLFVPHPYFSELYYFLAYTASPCHLKRDGTERGNLLVAIICLL